MKKNKKTKAQEEIPASGQSDSSHGALCRPLASHRAEVDAGTVGRSSAWQLSRAWRALDGRVVAGKGA